MSILMWDKPKQVLTKEEWSNIVADSAPPGVYQPNMSADDRLKWRAKLIKGNPPRVEIRKGYKCGVNQLVIVTLARGLSIGANGTIILGWEDYQELQQAIAEARQVLKSL